MDTLWSDSEYYFRQFLNTHQVTILQWYFQLFDPSIRDIEVQRIRSIDQLLKPRILISGLLILVFHLLLFLLTYLAAFSVVDLVTPFLDQLEIPYVETIFFGAIGASYLISIGSTVYSSRLWGVITEVNRYVLYLSGFKYLIYRVPLIVSMTIMRKVTGYSINLFPFIDIMLEQPLAY